MNELARFVRYPYLINPMLSSGTAPEHEKTRGFALREAPRLFLQVNNSQEPQTRSSITS